jgi:hypothetical protein
LGDNKIKTTGGVETSMATTYQMKECLGQSVLSMILRYRKKMRVYEAYNYFMEWVNSNGVNKNDWYKDKSVT